MKEIIENLMFSIAAIAIGAGLPMLAYSQYRLPAPVEKPELPVISPRAAPIPMIWGGDTSEKSIKVDNTIILELCVGQGTVKVNGWNRGEVRVYVDNGNKFAFNIREKDAKSGSPNWINIVGVAAGKKDKYTSTDCISADEIEIDVPVNATIKLKGHEVDTMIDSVRKVYVNAGGGEISLRNITGFISASAGQGDVTVESSKGPMTLNSTTGNIVVFEAEPGEIGDPFNARTNSGNISLQSVQHRQIEVGSTSGSVFYSGTIRSGGSYTVNTVIGSIRVSVPADSSCKISATYGAGRFHTELPIDILTENNVDGPIKTIVGTYGKGGDAALKLSTTNGSINVRKL